MEAIPLKFIRGKPISWDYKGWIAASPLGYAYSIDMYQGKMQERMAAATKTCMA